MATATRKRERAKRRRKGWAEQQNVLVYRIVVRSVGLLLKYWVRHYKAIGASNVPRQGGVFIIANHTSAMDPFLLGYPVSQRVLRGPGKVQLFQYRPVAAFLKKLGIFPIRQGVADAAAVRVMVELYRAGTAVIVYPEGGRSPDGQLIPLIPEFARLVIKLRAVVCPAAIAGANQVLPIGALIPKRNTYAAVAFGQPFELTEFYGQPLTDEAVARATQILEGHVARELEQARRERDEMILRDE